jgi:hypothetical protein
MVLGRRLLLFHTISRGVGGPTKTSMVVGLALWIHRYARGGESVEHSVQVMHLEIERRRLRDRKVIGSSG